MAISNATIAALNDFTWAQIKIMAKTAIGTALLGGNNLRSADGREIGRVTVDQAKEIYAWACEMEALESSDSGGGISLGEFGSPR